MALVLSDESGVRVPLTPDVAGPITFELMAQDTITFIETELCNMVITEFFTMDPVQTFAPIRRAASR